MNTRFPYERFRWLTQVLPDRFPATCVQFDAMIMHLMASGVTVSCYAHPRGTLVVTWKAPAVA